MKTIGEVLKLSRDFLAEKKVSSARRVAEEILAHILQFKRMDLYLQFDRPLIEKELEQIRECIKRCAKHEPLAYVLGSVEFFGCKIQVDPRVLIPRPETEILVEKIAKEAKQGMLWDLCTGSGCIGIALKKANPELELVLSDVSSDALALASENAKQNGVELTLLQGDLFAPFEGAKADWIVCNPPYVSEAEYLGLDPSVKDFEPRLALVGGPSGLEFYERLRKEAAEYLNPKGVLFCEIGAFQKEALQKVFPGAQIETDWAGHDRYLRINRDLLTS